MKQYKDLIKRVLTTGNVNQDERTGVGTKSVFGHQMRFDLKEGFPAVTTKKLAWKSVVSELLWFLEGSGDERRLAEILHGTRDESKKTIWTANANADYWVNGKYAGDLGRVYGVQWRNWLGYDVRARQPKEVHEGVEEVVVAHEYYIDQFQNIINTLNTNPECRRIILSAHNVAEMESGQMALPPCHNFAQFRTRMGEDGKRYLSCQMYQRSVDIGCGLPFNIASYALLVHILARFLGMEVDEFIWTGGDCHIYLNHIEELKEQSTRRCKQLPELKFKEPQTDDFDEYLNSLKVDDFELLGYKHHKPVPLKMNV